jgi:glycosyltransferase involved in cell wall biosynthesis
MKVLQLSYSKSGGAGAVASNLSAALNGIGVDSEFKYKLDTNLLNEPFRSLGSTLGAATDEYLAKRKSFRNPISLHREKFNKSVELNLKNYDLINLHWTPGFIRLAGIKELLLSGLPVVWTLHDMWAFTGVCHFSGDCLSFKSGCNECPAVHKVFQSSVRDLFSEKRELYSGSFSNLSFVAPSAWLASIAGESELLGSEKVAVIPNPVPEATLEDFSRLTVRSKFGIPSNAFVLVFIAANLDDPRKGLDVVLRSVSHAAGKSSNVKFTVLLIGEGKKRSLTTAQVVNVGFRSRSEISHLIAASDVSINFSSEENLSMAIIESFAAGTPVIGLDSGGNKEIIESGQSGFLVQSSNELEDRILELSSDSVTLGKFSAASLKHFRSNYAAKKVASEYLSLYKQRIGNHIKK